MTRVFKWFIILNSFMLKNRLTSRPWRMYMAIMGKEANAINIKKATNVGEPM